MHVITGLGVGGAETMLASLVKAEIAASQRPIVISLIPGGLVATQLKKAGIDVLDLGMVRGRPGFGSLFRLRSLIRRFRPDVLQSWMYHANLVATGALALSGRRRRTVHYWGLRCSDMDLDAYGWIFRSVVKAGGNFSAWPDAITCNSEAGITVHKALGYRPRRFLLVDNGVDIARFKPNPEARSAVREKFGIGPDTPVIATAARVDPMKDYPNLLAALDRLPQVTAIVMGDGTENLPDSSRLIRLGRCDRVEKVLAAADLVVSASAYG
ncbi:MAG: group 1 glycosyl transferase [Rhodospirillaceae bacterium]|nr:group 1 glycosyl transferase [Rhodospirillaceae bacterium]